MQNYKVQVELENGRIVWTTVTARSMSEARDIADNMFPNGRVLQVVPDMGF